MDNLKIKHKEFDVLEIVSKDTFKCSFKNKLYLVKKYDLDNSESRELFDQIIWLTHSSVKMAKIKIIDKKTGYVVKEYIEGTTVFDYILDNDFNESIYRQVFQNSYMAKIAGLSLDFSLSSWMLVGDDLYYVAEKCEKFRPEKEFTKTMLPIWFLCKELEKYYKNNGVLFDKSRIKDDYVVNKEMVLMTCRYYQ